MKKTLYGDIMKAGKFKEARNLMKENNIVFEELPLQIRKHINELCKKEPDPEGDPRIAFITDPIRRAKYIEEQRQKNK